MNKQMTKTQNEIQRTMKLMIKENEIDSVERSAISKSVDERPKVAESNKETDLKEEDDTVYLPVSSGRVTRPNHHLYQILNQC